MSVHEPTQFTPSQVLEAGRRAETEGRAEYALQFYRHIVDTYPGTGEAAAAQSALNRILGPPKPPPSLSASPHAPALEPRLDMPPPAQALNNPFDPQHAYQQHHYPPQGFGSTPPPLTQAPAYAERPGSSARDEEIAIDLPQNMREYMLGRFMARLTAWLGGLMVLGGFALVPVSVAMPRLLPQLSVLPLSATGHATLFIVVGLCLIFVGQMARALFDQANATRDLVELTRAQFEIRQLQSKRRARNR